LRQHRFALGRHPAVRIRDAVQALEELGLVGDERDAALMHERTEQHGVAGVAEVVVRGDLHRDALLLDDEPDLTLERGGARAGEDDIGAPAAQERGEHVERRGQPRQIEARHERREPAR
jgi:hypothetical protein